MYEAYYLLLLKSINSDETETWMSESPFSLPLGRLLVTTVFLHGERFLLRVDSVGIILETPSCLCHGSQTSLTR